ncbi:MAG: ABC transporter ATP-binding protein [Erysipelotrichaceae bacterium]|jgi:multiple sugar transport system ATP-binding protein
MANLKLKDINKIYDNNVQAVFDFNLDIKDREFIVLVGPSGCGKSTTLRMIAGLEDITSGELYIDEKLVNTVAPKDRDIAMVFQSYALYPHMSVYENMAFGLKLKKMPKDEIDTRVKEAARILEIEKYLDRKPKALSGGQRQRVALGRAIVRNAKVFLMDEPLSNLDAKLRVQMRSEIIKLHERLNATTIYVTHDQTEAMTMASRIVVMKDGYIQQIGTPKDIYNHPNNMFVANFIGAPAMNFINGVYRDGRFEVNNKSFKVPGMFHDRLKNYNGKDLVLGIRPEDIHYEGIVAEAFPETPFDFNVDVCELLGHEFILHGEFGGQKILAKVSSRVDVHAHDTIQLSMDVAKLHFFDKETTQSIY